MCILDGRQYNVLEELGRQNVEEAVEECVILSNGQVSIDKPAYFLLPRTSRVDITLT